MSMDDIPASPELGAEVIAPVPRVTLQAFCETHDVAAVIQAAITDRRMAKALSKVQMGGPAAAAEAFKDSPTPNVLIIENTSEHASLVAHLETLASVCDEGTRVIVVGHLNDVALYRDLVGRGVSDYLIAPISTIDVVRSVSQLFSRSGGPRLGRVIAVLGAKGGAGSSTVAHNVSWAIAQNLDSSTVLVDLDLAFGTAGLDFNQDPPQGVAEAIYAPDRIDMAMVDRLLSRCSDNLSLLAAPAMLDRTYDFGEESLDGLIDILRGLVPVIVLDMPHQWSSWIRRALVTADDILVVATPDLASLRNTKNILDICRQARVNDRQPHVMLSQTGVPKRPEIPAAEFSKALGVKLVGNIAFDPQLFGTAANNGQMIAEVQAGHAAAQAFVEIASGLLGRPTLRPGRRNLLEPLLAKFTRRAAS